MRRSISALICVAALAGCTSMSGLDSSSNFACKAPDGVTCTSLSGVYANVVANNFPNQPAKEGEGVASKMGAPAPRITGNPASSGDPIRSPQKVVRVWIAPWEDAEGDLHDQSFIYVVQRESEWMIEHNRRAITDRYRPTFAQPAAKPQSKRSPAAAQAGSSAAGLAAPALPGNQLVPPPARQLSSTTNDDGDSQ